MEFNQILGAVFLVFGIASIPIRLFKPEWFGKLDRMKSAYGETAGTMVHVLGYTVVPIVAGAVMLLGGAI